MKAEAETTCCLLYPFRSVSTLTHLETVWHSGCSSMATVLDASRESLSSLAVTANESKSLREVLQSYFFPSLTSVRITEADSYYDPQCLTAMIPLLRVHSTQLRSIVIQGYSDELNALRALIFPLLETLTYRGGCFRDLMEIPQSRIHLTIDFTCTYFTKLENVSGKIVALRSGTLALDPRVREF